jgi:hypothetical protein
MARPTSHPRGVGVDPSGVLAWRRRQLERAGFASETAAALAADRRVDVHGLLELVERGCPAGLAERILAPLDGPDPPR